MTGRHRHVDRLSACMSHRCLEPSKPAGVGGVKGGGGVRRFSCMQQTEAKQQHQRRAYLQTRRWCHEQARRQPRDGTGRAAPGPPPASTSIGWCARPECADPAGGQTRRCRRTRRSSRAPRSRSLNGPAVATVASRWHPSPDATALVPPPEACYRHTTPVPPLENAARRGECQLFRTPPSRASPRATHGPHQ